MAKSLSRSQPSSSSKPVLDVWTLPGGILADVFSIEYAIFDVSTDAKYLEPVQVHPPSGRLDADSVGTQAGHYVAAWTPDTVEPLGRHRVVFYVVDEDGDDEREITYDFDVLPAGLRWRGGYALISDLRAEGIAIGAVSDKKAIELLAFVKKQIDRWTGNFFEPVFSSIVIEDTKSQSNWLDVPLLWLESVETNGGEVWRYRRFAERTGDTAEVDIAVATDFDPNLGDNSRLTLRVVLPRYSILLTQAGGFLTVNVAGLFGLTDKSEDLDTGETPDAIKRAAIMLVVRQSGALSDSEGNFDAQNAYRVKDIRTRDQGITYGDAGGSSGSAGDFSGDPAIDNLLLEFTAGPYVGGT